MILNGQATGNASIAELVVAVLLALGAPANPPVAALAQEPRNALPDGTWVRYHVSQSRIDVGTKSDHKLTMKLVGTVRQGEQVLRWVELEFLEGDGNRFVEKYLIPEISLLKGDSPAVDTVRGWSRLSDSSVAKAIDNKHSPAYTEEMLLLPGPLSHARELKESKTIDYQKGRISVARGLTREATATYPRADGKATRKITVSAWPHPDVPLGVAAARTSMQMYLNESRLATVEREYALEDTGTGAKSVLTEE